MEKASEAYESTLEHGHMDQRLWTPQHLQAANMATSMADPSLLALTPPQGDDLHGIKDVDVRGPGRKHYKYFIYEDWEYLSYKFSLLKTPIICASF